MNASNIIRRASVLHVLLGIYVVGFIQFGGSDIVLNNETVTYDSVATA